MHACALAVNDLYHELKLMRPSDPVQLQQFRHRYNSAVRRCPHNHTRIDYLMAKAEDGAMPWTDRAWAQLRYLLERFEFPFTIVCGAGFDEVPPADLHDLAFDAVA